MVMLKGPVEFCFFSGTGNTALAAGRIASALEARGVTVHMRPIEDTDPATLPSGATIGLACPAAAFTTYPLVWRFVRNLQPGMGAGVFLVVTMGGMTMGLVGPMKRLVRRKGYRPLGACRLVMPGNFMLKKIDRQADRARIDRALARCDSFASSLADGRSHWIRIPGWPDLVASLIANDRPFSSMRKKLSMSVDRPACTRCGLCVSHCPVSNIRMVDYPAWADRCELCMRCHGICPTDAIRIGGKKYAQYYAKLGQQASAIQQ
jgi:ferredoxin